MSEWQPIETAPKDFTPVLIAALGIENTGWMINVMRWGCRTHCLDSFRHSSQCSESDPECDMRWLGSLGAGLGVPALHWMPLPDPPER